MKDENNAVVGKYCKDCKHIGYAVGYSPTVELVCTNFALIKRDIVTSEIVKLCH
jgi:hypothetical protein